MTKHVAIVGGGAAGWMTAAYLARMLTANSPGGVKITLIESEDIGTIGVGEGTFPSIRKTLQRIGIDESALICEANATFKQGVQFVNWKHGPDKPDDYLHPFQISDLPTGLQLLPYWLLGAAGDKAWDGVSTPQRRVVEAFRAPKLIGHDDYTGPLAYAYHFDAADFAKLLRRKAVALGVQHIIDTVHDVQMTDDGAIGAVVTGKHGNISADLYIDCTGFRAQLIGEALKSPFRSYQHQIFTDRAVAMQVPYANPDGPVPSATRAVAQTNGWIWDIGLGSRRGTGYVYSSSHCSDESAIDTLRKYIGPAAEGISPRKLKFEAGYRPVQWIKNCVSIGLSSGFIEPLEATGIGFVEVAALYVATLFAWDGPVDAGAEVFNRFMCRRYQNAIDFIKLHYALSARSDSDFWRDNRAPLTLSDDLKDRLDRWRHRIPDFVDVDLSVDIFTPANWQYVLYGMGYRTDLSARKGAYRFYDEARAAFAENLRQGEYALTALPSHRDILNQIRAGGSPASNAA